MKRFIAHSLLLVLFLTFAACGGQTTLETWPITYTDILGCYTKSYPDIDSMLAEEHIIFHGKAVALVEEGEFGVDLELKPIATTGEVTGNIVLRQIKKEGIVLQKGEEAVLILYPAKYEDGIWEVFNDTCGMFRIDQNTDNVIGPRLDSLLESVPQTYSTKDLTLEQVYDLLVELDNAE